jgi:tetratricopeptide (TPR) repeat protein
MNLNQFYPLFGLISLIVFIVWVQLNYHSKKPPNSGGPESIEDLLKKSYTSLDAARHDGDKAAEAWALFEIASARMRQGNTDQAITHFLQAQDIAEKVDDRWKQMFILHSLGFALATAGRRDEAVEILRQGVSVCRDLRKWDMEISMRRQLGATLIQSNQMDEALEQHLVVAKLAKATGDVAVEADSLLTCAQCYRTLGDAEAEERYLKRARRRAPRLEDIANGDIAVRLGAIYGQSGDVDTAKRHFRRALDLFEQDTGPPNTYRIRALIRMASVIGKYDDHHLALDMHSAALKIAEDGENQAQIAICLNNMAWTQIQLGRLKDASRNVTASLQMANELEDRRVEGFARSTLAELYVEQGEKDRAQEELRVLRSIADELENARLLQICDDLAEKLAEGS